MALTMGNLARVTRWPKRRGGVMNKMPSPLQNSIDFGFAYAPSN